MSIAAIDADLAADRLPFLVSANAGTTNTGAVDPIGELADACHERGVWLHVDGAYGAFAVLTDRGKRAMHGINKADSITLDPHKWLAMPFEVGCLLVREGRLLEQAFELHPEYLKEGHEGGVNFADRGLQLTRASRAIKIWLAIETFGLDAFRATIDRAIDQTQAAQARIEADPRLELVTPASLGILTFRRRGADDEPAAVTDRRNETIVQSLAASGELLVTSTLVKGRYAIRLCVLNHTTEIEDVAFAVDRVAEADVVRIRSCRCGADQAARLGHDGRVDRLGSRPGSAPRTCAGSATSKRSPTTRPIASLPPAARNGFRRGIVVTERWAHARTFYIVLDGEVSVTVDGVEVNRLVGGDSFGEIAAIDWGRDFSYGRTATVTATVPTRLLAVPGAALRELMLDSPGR